MKYLNLKVTYLILIITSFLCTNLVLGQSTKKSGQRILETTIDLTDLKSPNIKSLLEILKKVSEINLSYNENSISLLKKIELDGRKAYTLKQILDLISKADNLIYDQNRKQIILKKKPYSKVKKTLSGYIKDQVTGESLIGASIYDPLTRQGTSTNVFGYFSITLPEQEYNFQVRYVGYKNKNVLVNLTTDQVENIYLESGLELEEVVVTADESIEETPQMSSIGLPIEQIKSMPVLMGEADVLKAIQLLPGIQGGTEGSSGIFVRGGSADQNLILLDGVPVYNVSHLFGFFSIFNPEAINQVNVIKGGFPARYGGRLSSVIDISMKEGNNQKIGGSAAIGLISSKATVEGPISKDKKTTFILSGRRTYIDLLTKPFTKKPEDGGKRSGYHFYDVSAKVNRTISDRDRIFFSLYKGRDVGNFKDNYVDTLNNTKVIEESNFKLSWGNTTGVFRWNHIINPKLFANLTTTYSRFNIKVQSEVNTATLSNGIINNEFEKLTYTSGIDDLSFKLDFDYLPSPQHSIKTGASITNHTFSPGIETKRRNTIDQNFSNETGSRIKAWELSTYIEDDFKFSSRFRGNIGFHYSGFAVENDYYQSFQPRVSLRYLMGSNLSIKGSFSSMQQFIHLLSNSGIGFPTDLWVPSTDEIKPQKGYQLALGVAKSYNKIEASVEFYYKDMSGLIEYREGASLFSSDAKWQEQIVSGAGESYGTEVLLQKKAGKLSGWVGYTLSWTNRKFDDLNNGEEFPFKYDKRHDLSIVGVYKFNNHLSLSSTWVYGTGGRLTLPTSTYNSPQNETDISEAKTYSTRNNFKMSDYHRLDVGITWSKVKKRGERSWSLGAYNAYNRKNAFFIDTGVDDKTGEKAFIKHTVFPVLPYVRYSFKF